MRHQKKKQRMLTFSRWLNQTWRSWSCLSLVTWKLHLFDSGATMKLCGSFVLITLACAERLSKYRTDDIAQAAQARYAQAESMEGNSSVKWFTPSRMEYVKSKMAIEYEVIKPFTSKADSLQVELASGTPKVAFLFLTMKDFPWQELWDKFFHDAPKDQYSIYIHRALLKDQEQRMAHWLPLGQYGPIEVPWVRTAWCALFGVEVASLFEAMKDPLNVQFVFVSDSSVPLKPFSYVYNELARNSPQTSKICLASRASSGQAKVEFTKQEAKRSCFFRDFLRDINPRTMKHHQWAVFNRPHAWKIVKYAEEALTVYEVAWLNAAPDMDVTAEGCSDEAVPLTALLYSLDVEKKSTGTKNNTVLICLSHWIGSSQSRSHLDIWICHLPGLDTSNESILLIRIS